MIQRHLCWRSCDFFSRIATFIFDLRKNCQDQIQGLFFSLSQCCSGPFSWKKNEETIIEILLQLPTAATKCHKWGHSNPSMGGDHWQLPKTSRTCEASRLAAPRTCRTCKANSCATVEFGHNKALTAESMYHFDPFVASGTLLHTFPQSTTDNPARQITPIL